MVFDVLFGHVTTESTQNISTTAVESTVKAQGLESLVNNGR